MPARARGLNPREPAQTQVVYIQILQPQAPPPPKQTTGQIILAGAFEIIAAAIGIAR